MFIKSKNNDKWTKRKKWDSPTSSDNWLSALHFHIASLLCKYSND